MILEQHAKTCMMQLSISIKRPFISWNAYNRNTKGIIINDLSMHFKKLEKEQQESTGWQKNNKDKSRYQWCRKPMEKISTA